MTDTKAIDWEVQDESFDDGEPMGIGDHIVTLEDVKQVEVDDKYGPDPTVKIKKAVWRFVNDAGEVLNVWTKLKYGNEKAAITVLLNRLVPGMCREMFGPALIESLIGQRFKGIVEQAPGKEYCKFAFLAPLTTPPPPAKSQAKPSTAAPPAKPPVVTAAPVSTPGSGNARILALRERLMGYGWPKSTAISMLKNHIGDQTNTEGIDQYEECLTVLDQNRLELVQRGHSEENASSFCRQHVTDPCDFELMNEFEEKIRGRAFDLELEGASPDPNAFVDPFEDAA